MCEFQQLTKLTKKPFQWTKQQWNEKYLKALIMQRIPMLVYYEDLHHGILLVNNF